MMNLRFTICDLRSALAGGRPLAVSFDLKSSIIIHKFTAIHWPAAKR
jgi:acid phosphatase class B